MPNQSKGNGAVIAIIIVVVILLGVGIGVAVWWFAFRKLSNGKACTTANALKCSSTFCIDSVCSPYAAGSVTIGGVCTSNNQCSSNNCDNTTGKCAAPLAIAGSSCSQNSDCLSGVCASNLYTGTLIATGNGPCVVDSNCILGDTCDQTTNKCVASG